MRLDFSTPEQPTIRTRVVEVSQDYQILQADRTIMVNATGVTVTLPQHNDYLQGKVIAVVNASGGNVYVEPFAGDTIKVGGEYMTRLEMSDLNLSRDFTCNVQNWITQ